MTLKERDLVGEWALLDGDGVTEVHAALAIEASYQALIELAKRLANECHMDREWVGRMVRDTMYKIMNNYQDQGARDTEPESVLVDRISVTLGVWISRW